MALVTLAEAKAQLDIQTDGDDAELQSYIDAVTPVIERYVGPVESRQISETIEGRGATMCLTQIPAIALVSLTPVLPAGNPLDLGTLFLDAPKGIVYRRTGTFAGTLWAAVYTAGRGEALATINLAARLLIAHLWRTQYGAARGGGGSDDYAVTEPVPGFGYAVPNRVLELLEPFKLPPGVA